MVKHIDFYVLLIICFAEVSYPDDEILPQEVPSDAATIVQPEAAFIAPAVVPQFDRTRKPMNNLKPESPTIEKQEVPIEPVGLQFYQFL